MFGVPTEGADGVDPEWWDDFPGSPGGSRRPAVRGRITGRIVEWKGKFGWIQPDAPIMHNEARVKGGKVYLSQEDVADVISGVGAHVSFYVYADGTGLGAMSCVPADSPMARQPIRKAKAKPKSKLAAKSKATPGRKRIGAEPLLGKVKSWSGSFGFVTPDSPVEHPLFTGSLFLHANDVTTPESMEVGRQVAFYLYSDPKGLGATDCTALGGDEGDGDAGSSSELHEPSTLLKAKPKAAPSPAEGVVGLMAPKPKAMMKASAKASSAARAADPELARKMAENPALARLLSAWLFDPGG